MRGAYGILEKNSLDHTMYHFWMSFMVYGGKKLEDLSLVQTYASFPDPDAPGKYQSFTCNARYASYLDHANVYEVFNYYGELPF